MSLVGFCPIKIMDKHGETFEVQFFSFFGVCFVVCS